MSDHLSTAPGGSGPVTPTNLVSNEVVSGSDMGPWTLAHTPQVGTEQVYGGGSRLYPIMDYTISGAVITTVNSYAAGQLLASYFY